jgi:hypothetical protein
MSLLLCTLTTVAMVRSLPDHLQLALSTVPLAHLHHGQSAWPECMQ